MSKKTTMGFVAFLPTIYFLFFGYYSWAPFLGMLLLLVTLSVFIADVFKNNKVKKDLKAVWVIILLMGNLIAMPIYWYLYIWRDGKRK